MTCDELRKNLDNYFEGVLEPDKAHEFKASLAECPDVQKELELLNKISKHLKNLPLSFEPPEDLVPELTDILMNMKTDEIDESQLTKEEKKLRKREEAYLNKRRRLRHKKEKIEKEVPTESFTNKAKITLTENKLSLSLLIIFSAFFIYYFGFFAMSTDPWIIRLIEGDFTLNGAPVTKGELNEGDVIETGTNARVSVIIKEHGEIILEPNSSFVVIEANTSNNEIGFKKGTLTFNAFSFRPEFHLVYNAVHVKDFQSKFRFQIDSLNNSVVTVLDGYVEIIVPNDRILVSNDYTCTVLNNNIILPPFYVGATSKLKSNLKYLHNNYTDLAALSTILLEANEYDALTLLRLLEKVHPTSRELIFPKISQQYPLPKGATKSGILNLDREMLDLWWLDIDWQF